MLEEHVYLKLQVFLIFVLAFSILIMNEESQNASALTPVADLTGTWSGFAVVQNVEGTCEFTGKVTANIKQSGDQITGEYSYVGTSAKPSSPDYYCSDFNYSEKFYGTLDGSRISLRSASGTFSGSYASSGIGLHIQSSELVGTVKLSPTNFTPAPFESKNNPSPQEDQDVNAMIQVGVSYLHEKQFDKALEYFNKIIEKEPNNVMGWMGKGVSYVGLKNYDQAITHFKKSLEISPNNKDVLQWLGIAYYLQNDCQTAASYYSDALKIDPQNTKLLAEKKIVNTCLKKQVEAKNKAKSLESKLNPKPETKTPPVLVDPSGKPIKEPNKETKTPPVLVDPSGKPIKEPNKEKPETKTKPKTEPTPKESPPKTLVTLEMRNKFRDSVVDAFGSDPQIRKYVDGITIISRDSNNFDTEKTFNDLDVTAAINTKDERKQLEKNSILNQEKLAEIDDARKAIQKMWTEADKRFKSKTGMTLADAGIFVYDEYGGRPFNAQDKPEGYSRAEAVKVMLASEKFSVIPLYFDEKTGKAYAGKLFTSIPIGSVIEINDVREYAKEFLDKIGNDTKQKKPLNPKYITKVADVLDKLVKNQKISAMKLKQYLTNADRLVIKSAREGEKIDELQAKAFLKKISTLNL
ncbi:MAG TPA: tetratricopeptide repeat protein [Candidatus Nitrosotenuis sp.]|nr:tetratricopeptide repeat protein [Candidatus Nitrosotenuis sp.]